MSKSKVVRVGRNNWKRGLIAHASLHSKRKMNWKAAKKWYKRQGRVRGIKASEVDNA